MRNAKIELLKTIENTAKIKCASIVRDEGVKIILKLNYTNDEYNEFLRLLDFNYDGGYGVQEIYGVVWLEDNTWLSRGEYDGSEWWEHNVLPDIPLECVKQ